MLETVIDLETTGTDHEHDKIVEVGFCDAAGGKRFSKVCDPGIPIPAEACAVHHITDNHVVGHPFAHNLDYPESRYYVSHNSRFDAPFMAWVKARWVCTYRCALRVWPDAPNHKLQTLRYWLRLDEKGLGIQLAGLGTYPHRALYDAVTCAALYRELLRDHNRKTLYEWSCEPALLSVCLFGKHAGTPWSDVPKSYLKWILDQEFEEDVVHTAKHYLGA